VHAKGGTTFADYDFAYDRAGQLTGFDFTSLVGDSGDAAYSHDATGQLTGSDYTGDWQGDEDYTYDENGNRTTAGGASYATGPNNQLLSDGTYRYEYDAEGNRTLRFVDADQSGTLTAGDTAITAYAWDHRNRLVEVRDFADHAAYTAGTPSQIVQYAYDFGNRWVRKVLDADGDGVADASTIFVHDDGQIVLDFAHTGPGDAAAADLAHRYLWGPAVDQLLADEQMSPLPPGEGQGEGYDLSTPGETLWALTDHLNSVRDLAQYDEATDTTTIARHLVYDAFGNLTSDTAPAVPSLFLYTARPFDEHTGLQNNLHRWYDAVVGRWLSEDPIGFEAGDGNLHRYVGNSPLMQIDEDGLSSETVYEAMRDGDDLEMLARQVTRDARNWVCIWPQPTFVEIIVTMPQLDPNPTIIPNFPALDFWEDYPKAKKCARADVSNLTATAGKSLVMHPHFDAPNDPYLRVLTALMGEGAWEWKDGPAAGRKIADESGQGATPIGFMFIGAHANRDLSFGNAQGGARFDIQHLWDAAVEKDNNTNTFESALAKQGRPKCWFTRNAHVYGFGCTIKKWATTWGNDILRTGATAHGTQKDTKPYTHPQWAVSIGKEDNPRMRATRLQDVLRLRGWTNTPGKQ